MTILLSESVITDCEKDQPEPKKVRNNIVWDSFMY